MLISDWSSDVCSSDLTQLFARLTCQSRLPWRALGSGSVIAELGGADPLRVSWICPHWPGRSLVVLYRVSQRRTLHLLAAGLAAKIGRASCRERMCPYV